MAKQIWYKIGDLKAIALNDYLREDDDVTGDRQIRFANLRGVLQVLPDSKLDALKRKCYAAFQAAAPGDKKGAYQDGYEVLQSMLRDNKQGRENRKAWKAYERTL